MKHISFNDIRTAATKLFKARYNFEIDMNRPIDEEDLKDWKECINDAIACATTFGLTVI